MADEPQMFAIVSNPDTHRYLGGMANRADHFTRFQRGGGSWFLHGYGSFMVRLKGSQDLVANCGVFRSHRGFGQGLDDVPEAGWIVHRDHWGQGIAREVMEAALAWFDSAHGRQRIACMIEDGHAASDALAGKLGFVRYGQHQPDSGPALVLYERLVA